ncbi:hypothetical protein SAY87_015568 [Trapa incisa]|uniref:Uncharacterized protein n=1 Tax=Trapa incisa TaxID=236973 RepID=A0AAN7QUR1_9MYRT|nr:hypothetical protein SAY87_015568 [Trapa incisa]
MKAETEGKECALVRRCALLLLCVVVFSFEVTCLLAVAAHERDYDRPAPAPPLGSPSRKSRLFGTVPVVHAPISAASVPHVAINDYPDPDKLYEEDKRIIHTGPNPLHN